MDITLAKDGDLGHYYSPGYKPRPYAGIVYGPIPIRFNANVVITIPFIKVIDASRRMVILGADVLAGGRAIDRWNFKAMPIYTDQQEDTFGTIIFSC